MTSEDITQTLKSDKNILSMICYISSQQEEDGKFITLVNKTISSSKFRLKGLELLKSNIDNLPLELVLDNAFLWINICIGPHHKYLKEIKLTIIGNTLIMELIIKSKYILFL